MIPTAREIGRRDLLKTAGAIVVASACRCVPLQAHADPLPLAVLDPEPFAAAVERFSRLEPETVVNAVPDAAAWEWLRGNAPLFECPDPQVQEIALYRWWTYRKHLKATPQGFVVTEFLTPVKHAGVYNTISCAFGHHLAEGRWLSDRRYLDDTTRFWFRGSEGRPQPHFHQFSSWTAAALYDRLLVTVDRAFLTDLLDDLAADDRAWERERGTPEGPFWQFDVRDGMEESISGSRTVKNFRPTINSYMAANARAIAAAARMADRKELAAEFEAKAAERRRLTLAALWDPAVNFFKVRRPGGEFSDAREAIGFLPWTFSLADSAHAAAWAQFTDPQGFRAPWGITTAERRHLKFRSHGCCKCEWDGAVWPFATAQTLVGLANVLRDTPAAPVTRQDYFDAFLTYARSHYHDGRPYIGEYLDETTGRWLKGDERSRFYNHSTFNDPLITGLAGLRPRADDTVEVDPLLPEGAWSWFCLDGVPYHGRSLTILWDATGQRYRRGVGLQLLADGKRIAGSPRLERVTGMLAPGGDRSPVR